MRRINEIIVHCTATKEGEDYHRNDIDKWHKAKGWKGIGYHYLITLDGTVEPGRPVGQIGAHTTGHNANSIGVCYVGGLDKNGKPKDTRTGEQKLALYKLLYDLKLFYSDARIGVHNEFAAKACPCFSRAQLMDELNLWWKVQKLTGNCIFK